MLYVAMLQSYPEFHEIYLVGWATEALNRFATNLDPGYALSKWASPIEALRQL